VTTTARDLGHLIADVRRFGLLSASSVVDRYIDLVDRLLGPDPLARTDGSERVGGPTTRAWFDGAVRPGGTAASNDLGLLAEATARMAQAYVAMLDAAAHVVGAPATTGAADGAPAVLPDTAPGGTAQVTLWLHNPTASDVCDVTVAVTSLVSPEGAAVPVASVHPTLLPVLAAGSSTPVRLVTVLAPDQAPGTYHGLVLASADPDEPVAVRMRVVQPRETAR